MCLRRRHTRARLDSPLDPAQQPDAHVLVEEELSACWHARGSWMCQEAQEVCVTLQSTCILTTSHDKSCGHQNHEAARADSKKGRE